MKKDIILSAVLDPYGEDYFDDKKFESFESLEQWVEENYEEWTSCVIYLFRSKSNV
jgi:hypothetical protein